MVDNAPGEKMKSIQKTVLVAAAAACLSPTLAQAQSIEDLVARLDKLETENRELRRDLDTLRSTDAAPLAVAAPVETFQTVQTLEVQPTAAARDMAPGSTSLVSLASAHTYGMLDPTTNTNRKQLYLLGARRDGTLGTGVYLGGAITALADYQSSNRDNKFGYLMRHPTASNQIGNTVSEAVIHSAQFSLTANVSPWITGYAEFLYDPEQSFGAGTITALARNQIQLRKGYVVFGDLNRSPFYAAIGKMEAPFGLGETVNPFTASTMWHAFGGLSYGALLGYSSDGLNLSVEAVQGGAQFRALHVPVEGSAVPSRLINYVVDANYTFDLGNQSRSLMMGASYEAGSAYCQPFPVVHFTSCPEANPAYALYGKLKWDAFTLIGDFGETQKVWPGTFNPAPPLNVFPAHRVSSFGVGGKFATEMYGAPADLSLDFSTFVAGPDGSPWHRQDQWVLGLAVFPTPSVKLFSEIVLVDGYAPLNFISGGNLAPGLTHSDDSNRSQVFLAGVNLAF